MDKLASKTMKELIKIGHGLYKVGMTRKELIAKILDNQIGEETAMAMTKEQCKEVALMLEKLTVPGMFTYNSLDEMFYETSNGVRVGMFTPDEILTVLRINIDHAKETIGMELDFIGLKKDRIRNADKLLLKLEKP